MEAGAVKERYISDELGLIKPFDGSITPKGAGLYQVDRPWLWNFEDPQVKTDDKQLRRSHAESQKTPCTFNFNLVNESNVRLGKADLTAIENELNRIFATGGYRATLNKPGAASVPEFNFNLTIYNNFPVNYPQSARGDSKTIGYTLETRQIPDSPYPNIYFPGSTGGVSAGHIRQSYGARSTRPAALAYIVAGVGAHEAIAHYLLMEPGHPEQYATGITADGFDYRKNINRFISDAVKEQLDKVCSSGQLPK